MAIEGAGQADADATIRLVDCSSTVWQILPGDQTSPIHSSLGGVDGVDGDDAIFGLGLPEFQTFSQRSWCTRKDS